MLDVFEIIWPYAFSRLAPLVSARSFALLLQILERFGQLGTLMPPDKTRSWSSSGAGAAAAFGAIFRVGLTERPLRQRARGRRCRSVAQLFEECSMYAAFVTKRDQQCDASTFNFARLAMPHHTTITLLSFLSTSAAFSVQYLPMASAGRTVASRTNKPYCSAASSAISRVRMFCCSSARFGCSGLYGEGT